MPLYSVGVWGKVDLHTRGNIDGFRRAKEPKKLKMIGPVNAFVANKEFNSPELHEKMLLPFYDVFDDQRYFAPAEKQHLCHFSGKRMALTICEDTWNDKNFWPQRLYPVDPIEDIMRQKTTILLNISASPFWHGLCRIMFIRLRSRPRGFRARVRCVFARPASPGCRIVIAIGRFHLPSREAAFW